MGFLRQIGTLPLPDGWPRRVRSAVVHAISLAQASLTATRNRAADHWNARVQLRVENDRLRQEILMLREEIRIKDARMQHLDPQRRPHYPPTERLAILEVLRPATGLLPGPPGPSSSHPSPSPPGPAAWTRRGPRPWLRLPEPVNRFPDYVGHEAILRASTEDGPRLREIGA
jgi:hypothetical protein